jgi:uncharacterized protein YjgD (DUF1641 family)
MTNLEKLAKVGLLDPKRVSKQHQDIINNQLSNEEVAALISTQQKLGGKGSMHSESVGQGPSTAVF